jgi:hypothetical protein
MAKQGGGFDLSKEPCSIATATVNTARTTVIPVAAKKRIQLAAIAWPPLVAVLMSRTVVVGCSRTKRTSKFISCALPGFAFLVVAVVGMYLSKRKGVGVMDHTINLSFSQLNHGCRARYLCSPGASQTISNHLSNLLN